MTASVPVPQEPHPPEPGADAPSRPKRGPSRVPPKPDVAATEAVEASESEVAPVATPKPRPPRPRAKGTRPPRKRAPQTPGPPPPLPPDLADVVVVPPKPPVPAPEADAGASAGAPGDAVETSPVTEPAPTSDPVADEVAPDGDVAPDEVDSDADVASDEVASDADVALDGDTAPDAAPDGDVAPDAEENAPVPDADRSEAAASEPTETAAEPLVGTVPGALVEPSRSAAVLVVTAPPEASTDEASPNGAAATPPALQIRGVTKAFGDTRAVDGIDLTVPAGSFYGIVGPNGAGKTTTLSMIAGLLRPDSGSISVNGVDAAHDPRRVKRLIGVLPDRLRTFDRLSGRQLLYYFGVLRGMSPSVVESRIDDLARAFDLTDALGRAVSDYSAGMTKKVMLAGAMIHSPRLLVLDEPFEAVDPVSSSVILDILSAYVAHGGTVILSSHGMALVERACSRVAVLVAGQVLAEGTLDEVRGELTLEQRFVQLAGGLSDVEGLEWLHTFSD